MYILTIYILIQSPNYYIWIQFSFRWVLVWFQRIQYFSTTIQLWASSPYQCNTVRSGSPKFAAPEGWAIGSVPVWGWRKGWFLSGHFSASEVQSLDHRNGETEEEKLPFELAMLRSCWSMVFSNLRCRFTNLDWKVNGYELEAPQLRGESVPVDLSRFISGYPIGIPGLYLVIPGISESKNVLRLFLDSINDQGDS